ncbi:hypothetical protein HS088_TW03G00683 [Tripterygium wilfordii]|uniref:Serine-rich protein-related n=1 Tax=Tripterygium wilfordii TaxID=458696 RepID=A0A7J7DVK5_TRIWF|nr:hypothetical protein HS088_TW03G00683 [Tripterygium wilfordii]
MSEEKTKRDGDFSSKENPLKHSIMRKSWSTDSLSSTAFGRTCVCSPTKHEGSFRCRLHHRTSLNNHQNYESQIHGNPKPEAEESK